MQYGHLWKNLHIPTLMAYHIQPLTLEKKFHKTGSVRLLGDTRSFCRCLVKSGHKLVLSTTFTTVWLCPIRH